MRTARGKRYPIEDFGDLPLTCRFSGGEVPLLLCDVAHVPSVSYHVFFRASQPTTWHTYTGNKNGVRSLKLVTLYFPCQCVGRLGLLCAYRPGALVKEKANASIDFGLPSWYQRLPRHPRPCPRGSPAQDGQVEWSSPSWEHCMSVGLMFNGEKHQDASFLEYS